MLFGKVEGSPEAVRERKIISRLGEEDTRIKLTSQVNGGMVGETMYKRMVLCITEATPEEVVQAAIKLCSKDTEVYVLHVVHLLSDFVRKEVSKKFSWVTNLFEKAGVKSRIDTVESTDIKKAIISFAKKKFCDAIVTGTIPRKGLLGFFSESISDYLVKNAPCTVILVRKAGQPP